MNSQNKEPGKSIPDAPKRRQSPRKRIIPIKDMKKNDSVKYSNLKHLGRRTGVDVCAGKTIRLLPDGTENFEDYWTDESSSEASYVTESSLAKSSIAVSKASLSNYNEAEKEMLDKAGSTSKNVKVTDSSSIRIKSTRNTSGQHNQSTKQTFNESAKEPIQDLSQSVPSSMRSSIESLNRSKTNKAKQRPFKDNVDKGRNKNINSFEKVPSNTKSKNRHYSQSMISQDDEPSKSISDFPERRQSPRKRMTPIKDMKKNAAVRYSTLQHVGRRTGVDVCAGKKIRLLPDGTENFEDYWTDESSSEASYVTESSLAKLSIALSEASLNNSDEAEKVVLDKACGTSRNVEVSDASSVSIKSNKNISVRRSHSSKHTFNESENDPSRDLSQSVLSNTHSPNKSLNRSSTNTAKQKLFQNSSSRVGNENISHFETVSSSTKSKNHHYSQSMGSQNEDSHHQHSQNKSVSENSTSKIISRSGLEDPETDDESENVGPGGVVLSASKPKNAVLHSSLKGGISQNEEPLRNAMSKSTAKRSLNFSMSSVSNTKDTHTFLKQNKNLTEYSSSDEEPSDIETTSSGMERKSATYGLRDLSANVILQNEEVSNEHLYVSPRKSSLKKSFNTSFRNESTVNEDLKNIVEYNKIQERKSVSFLTPKDKDVNSFKSSKPRSILVEGIVREEDSDSVHNNDALSISIRSTGNALSRRKSHTVPSPRKSNNVSRSTRNKSNITEEVEFDKEQGTKSVSFRTDSGKVAKKVRKISQSKVASSSMSSKPKSMLIEDFVSEEDSDNDASSTSIRSTGNVPSRSSPRKSQNVSRLIRNKSNSTEEIETEVEFDKEQGKKSVPVRTESEEVANKIPKISQSKVASLSMSSKPKSTLIEDSVSEEESDNDAPSIGSTDTVSSRSSPRKSHNASRSTGNKNKGNITEEIQNDFKFDKKHGGKSVSFNTESEKVAKKVRKISQNKVASLSRSSKPKTMLIEDSVSEEDSDNDAPSTSIRSTATVPSRSSPRKSHNVSRSTGNKNKSNISGEIENDFEFNKEQSKTPFSFCTEGEKIAKKVSKIFRSKVASLSRTSKPKSMLIEDSVSEEHSDNDAPTSIRSTSRSSPIKCRNVSRPTRNKSNITEVTEKDIEFDKEQGKKSVSLSTEGEKIAKKVSKISQNKVASLPRSSKPKSMLIEDSVSEEDSDNDAPSTSIRSTTTVSSRSSPRKRHNVVRSTRNKSNIIGEVKRSRKTANKVQKNSLSKETSSIRSSKPKSMLIKDSANERDFDSVHDDGAPSSSIASTSKLSLRSSPRKNKSTLNLQSKLMESLVNDNPSKNIDYGKNESISRRFSPRKNSSRKYHSTPKSPLKSNQLSEKEHSIINENASVRPKSTTVSNNSRHISQTGNADSSRHGSRVIANQVIEEESRNAKDSGISSANDRSKNVQPQNSASAISKNDETNSQKLSTRKSLKNKKRSTSRSSKKRSKLLEDVEVEDESDGDNEIASIRPRKSQLKNSRVSRSVRRNSELHEDIARDSANEFEDISRDSADELEDIARASGNELDDTRANHISPTRGNVGVSTHSPSKKAAATKQLETSKAKRRSRALENDTVDPSEENEIVPEENVPKKKKPKKKRVENVQGPLRRSDRVHVRPLAFWHGERIKTRVIDGIIVSEGIISGWKEDDGAHVALQKLLESRRKDKIKKVEKITKRIPKSTVLNPHTNEYVDVNLHRPFSFSQWSAVGSEDGTKVPYYLTKTFSSETVTFGFLDICPLEVKSSQYSPVDNIHFIVQKGRVKVTIRKTTFEFEKYDSFIVPSTEAYCIENLGKSNALLSFCTFKIPFFPYQFNE